MNDDKLIDVLNAKNAYLKIEVKNKTKVVNEKKTHRINLWVTESFYEDIKTLLPAFDGQSMSETVVTLAQENLNLIKQNEVWKTLIELRGLQEAHDKLFDKQVEKDLDEESAKLNNL
jgi:cell wall assembly regulator SMI1